PPGSGPKGLRPRRGGPAPTARSQLSRSCEGSCFLTHVGAGDQGSFASKASERRYDAPAPATELGSRLASATAAPLTGAMNARRFTHPPIQVDASRIVDDFAQGLS